MGNTNMELEQRIRKLERQLEAFRTTIEPKSGEFIGQHWYNTATEVLNVWNGKQFTPAYGNSIIKDLNGFETRLSQTEETIQFDVVKDDEIISKINLSLEGIRIRRSKIYIDGSVSFASGYNPSQKVATGGAASDINTYTTTINGGKITTNSITADKINVTDLFAQNITATGTITGLTLNGSSIIGGFFRTYEDENQSWLEAQDNELRFYTLEGPGGSEIMRKITTGIGTGILLSGGTTIDTKLKIPVGTNLY